MNRIQRAIALVRSEMRGLPDEVAIERLRQALIGEAAYLSPHTLRTVARSLSDPWWPVRHPLRAWRDARTPEPDVEGEILSAEDAALEALFEDVFAHRLSYISRRSRRTFAGVRHQVTIHPWSESIAREIEDAAAPIRVEVLPARD
jgi:hypothetical protein